jgi:hypothetical protein
VVTASGSKGFLVLLLRNDGRGTGQDRKRLSEDLGETDGGLLVVGPVPHRSMSLHNLAGALGGGDDEAVPTVDDVVGIVDRL